MSRKALSIFVDVEIQAVSSVCLPIKPAVSQRIIIIFRLIKFVPELLLQGFLRRLCDTVSFFMYDELSFLRSYVFECDPFFSDILHTTVKKKQNISI